MMFRAAPVVGEPALPHDVGLPWDEGLGANFPKGTDFPSFWIEGPAQLAVAWNGIGTLGRELQIAWLREGGDGGKTLLRKVDAQGVAVTRHICIRGKEDAKCAAGHRYQELAGRAGKRQWLTVAAESLGVV